MEVSGKRKVVVNLATGHEDSEKVTEAFLVATAALEASRPTVMFLTREAVRFAMEGCPAPIPIPGAPPLARLFERFALDGGEFYVCPISFKARSLDKNTLVANARLADARALWDWVDEGATVFSY
jgi:predicted peroxiredoxin